VESYIRNRDRDGDRGTDWDRESIGVQLGIGIRIWIGFEHRIISACSNCNLDQLLR